MRIPFSYLPMQFADADAIWAKIRAVVERGDFTLGQELAAFEEAFAEKIGVRHAIGVNSGTDALFLTLKARGIKGQVITTPYSFYATTATIVHAGATPVFADTGYCFNLNPSAVAAAITDQTEAIVAVHWAGRPCDIAFLRDLADRKGLLLIEDAAHAFGARWADRACGAWGHAGAFSMHPLKTLNVWGDGGVITTDDILLADKLRRMRNHGMRNRDVCEEWGWNSRLDTIQAVVAHHVMARIDAIILRRRMNADRLFAQLRDVKEIAWAEQLPQSFHTYYLFSVRALERRDELVAGLQSLGVDAKVHYPTPLHLQPAARHLGYIEGDFPVAEELAKTTITLPAHEFVTNEQIDFMAAAVRSFYGYPPFQLQSSAP